MVKILLVFTDLGCSWGDDGDKRQRQTETETETETEKHNGEDSVGFYRPGL